ncbi:hypothetical protein MBCUT_17690 [Methanobrevibacter cuticularis]|uniref:Phosphoesterase n=1 Tax=Methanobrevibacter cuticularis TaxID=47311 RepID=A0A166CZG6_9EURY|nr:metallophosphoesterase family protein [Methanobrevibacter cuticularis]KZX15035.1 hypothetical protein MBCUT_17690 [Methanobrevibacter cuticularis]
MLIGLISDTHIKENNEGKAIPQAVFEGFKDVELIIHAGDLLNLNVIKDLEKIAPVIAVQGNMDRKYGLDLPKSETVEVDNVTIGVNHGEVYPQGDSQQLHYIAQELEADILVSGHTHQPHIENYEGILLLNPGSPTYPRLADPTIMLLTIENGESDIEVKKIGKSVCTALNIEKKE